MTRIPLELAEQTIDALWDDEVSLRACALTCHAWLSRSRVHLFRVVRVVSSYQLRSLYHLLVDNPALRPLIRTVNATLADPTMSSLQEEVMIAEAGYMLQRPPVILLPVLPGLECWSFGSDEREPFVTSRLGPSPLHAILRQYPNMRELRLTGLRIDRATDLARLLLALPALRRLSFQDILILTTGSYWDTFLDHIETKSRVSSLQVNATHPFFCGLALCQLVEALSHMVSDLAIGAGCLKEEGSDNDEMPRISLTRFTVMRSVTILMRHDYDTSLKALHQDLKVLGPVIHVVQGELPAAIEMLTIDLTECPPYLVFVCFESDWLSFDDAIAGTESLHPHLRRVTTKLPRAKTRLVDNWALEWASLLSHCRMHSFYAVDFAIDISPDSYRHTESPLRSLKTLATGKWVITLAKDGLYIWDVDVGHLVLERPGWDGVQGEMSSNGRYCAISYITHTYLKGVIVTLTAPEGLTNPVLIPGAYTSYTTFGSIRSRAISLAIIPSLSKVVVMLDDGSIKVTGVHGGKWVDSIEGANGGSIGSLHSHAFATSSDDRWLADWHTPGAIRVWKVTAEPPHLQLHSTFTFPEVPGSGSSQRVSAHTATFDEHSTTLLAVSGDRRTVWAWDVATGIPLRFPLTIPPSFCITPTSNVQFSPLGTHIAWIVDSEEEDPRMIVASFMRYPVRYVVSNLGHTACIHAFAFSPDGAYIATASADHTVRVCSTRDGACVATLTEHQAAVTHVDISADGSVLASGAKDGSVYIRRMRDILPLADDSNSE